MNEFYEFKASSRAIRVCINPGCTFGSGGNTHTSGCPNEKDDTYQPVCGVCKERHSTKVPCPKCPYCSKEVRCGRIHLEL